MTAHPLGREGMCSRSQACLPGNVTGLQAEVWSHKECKAVLRVAAFEPCHAEQHIDSGRPKAVKRDSRYVRVQASYPRSSNAAKAGLLKSMDTKGHDAAAELPEAP